MVINYQHVVADLAHALISISIHIWNEVNTSAAKQNLVLHKLICFSPLSFLDWWRQETWYFTSGRISIRGTLERSSQGQTGQHGQDDLNHFEWCFGSFSSCCSWPQPGPSLESFAAPHKKKLYIRHYQRHIPSFQHKKTKEYDRYIICGSIGNIL